jgi:hypothetical protein
MDGYSSNKKYSQDYSNFYMNEFKSGKWFFSKSHSSDEFGQPTGRSSKLLIPGYRYCRMIDGKQDMGIIDRCRFRYIKLILFGMVIYSEIVSPGYFAQQGQRAMVTMFGIILIGAVVAVFKVARSH